MWKIYFKVKGDFIVNKELNKNTFVHKHVMHLKFASGYM